MGDMEHGCQNNHGNLRKNERCPRVEKPFHTFMLLSPWPLTVCSPCRNSEIRNQIRRG